MGINFRRKKNIAKSIGLNKRQIKVVSIQKEHDFITNAEYREINETKQTLSSEELGEIVEKGILKSSGAKGRGAKYFLKK